MSTCVSRTTTVACVVNGIVFLELVVPCSQCARFTSSLASIMVSFKVGGGISNMFIDVHRCS